MNRLLPPTPVALTHLKADVTLYSCSRLLSMESWKSFLKRDVKLLWISVRADHTGFSTSRVSYLIGREGWIPTTRRFRMGYYVSIISYRTLKLFFSAISSYRGRAEEPPRGSSEPGMDRGSKRITWLIHRVLSIISVIGSR